MTCERYWREGVVLVERGLPDPHRAGCTDCRQAHDSRDELVRALPEIGAGYTGDPHWQANVWRRIEREHAPRLTRWRWGLGGALAIACAILLWLGRQDHRPRLELIEQTVAMRSKTHTIGEGVRVMVEEGDEIRIYRDERLELQCPTDPLGPGCTRDARGLVLEMFYELPGVYEVIVARAGIAGLSGVLDHDVATFQLANDSHLKRYKAWSVR
jgi:hypothetical protein